MTAITELHAGVECGAPTDCPGCATHPSRLPAPESRLDLSLVGPRTASGRRPRPRWKKVLLSIAGAFACLLAGTAIYIGFTVYRIDHAVHHVRIPAALLAQGRGDLLVMMSGPDHHEQVYLFNTKGGQNKVLLVPNTLSVEPGSGAPGTVPLSNLDIRRPRPIIAGLEKLGIPIGQYVGVDLHAASPTSSLGRLALGKISITSLISHPAGTSSLLQAVASHVYLGPHTSVTTLLTLMNVPAGTPVEVPTTTTADGHVVLAAPALSVLKHFL